MLLLQIPIDDKSIEQFSAIKFIKLLLRPIDNLNFCIRIDWFYKTKNQQTWKWFKQMNSYVFLNISKMVLIIFLIKSLWIEILNNAPVTASFEPSFFQLNLIEHFSPINSWHGSETWNYALKIYWFYNIKSQQIWYSTNEYYFFLKQKQIILAFWSFL